MIIRLTVQFAILLLLAGGVVLPLGLPSRSTPPVQAQAISPSACHGDEVITFAPTRPTVGQQLRIAVTSATTHRDVYLAGSEDVTTVSETQGQLGVVWLWSLIPQLSGPHNFEFFVDFTTFCADATIDVAPSPLSPMTAGLTPGSTGFACPTATPTMALTPVGLATPTLAGTASPVGSANPSLTPYPTPSACPTATPAGIASALGSAPGLATDPTPFVYPTSIPFTDPTPTTFDTGWNSNDNTNNSNSSISSNYNSNSSISSNYNANDNSFDNANNSYTDKLEKPSISSASCSDAGKQRLTIKGNHFGESLAAASGRVLVHDVASADGIEVSTYLSWTNKEIEVLVQGAVPKFDEVYVVTRGGVASKDLSASCST